MRSRDYARPSAVRSDTPEYGRVRLYVDPAADR